MRNFDENNITAAVLERFSQSQSPRVRFVSEALVRHLHNFIREIEPSFEEWEAGIRFLTRRRREMHVVAAGVHSALRYAREPRCWLTRSITACPRARLRRRFWGPSSFKARPFWSAAPTFRRANQESRFSSKAACVTADGAPIPGATIDVWHSDKDGFYDVQHYDEGGGTAMRAQFTSDEAGRFWLWTIVPTFYPVPDDGPGRRHVARSRSPSLSSRPRAFHDRRSWSRELSSPMSSSTATNIWIRTLSLASRTSLVRKLERREAGSSPLADGPSCDHPYAVMAYDFVLAPRLEAAMERRGKPGAKEKNS